MRILLLFGPFVPLLIPAFYNADAPELFGFPFFYWFQLLMIPVSAVCIYAAEQLRRED